MINKEETTMKRFITNIWALAALMIAPIAFVACSSNDFIDDGPKTYSMTIKVAKGDNAATKALTPGSHSITPSWGEYDEVTVINRTKSAVIDGTLKAATPGSSTATLQGTLTGTIDNGDLLYLVFPNTACTFTGQDGTLEKIATTYDYCLGKAKVTDASGANIIAGALPDGDGNVVFDEQQAIVKFTLLNKGNDAAIQATSLTINATTSGVSTLVNSIDLSKVTEGMNPAQIAALTTTGPLVITPTSATNELYVALNGVSGSDLTLTANDGTFSYTFTKSNVTFVNGNYYEVTVKMKNSLLGKVIGANGKIYNTAQAASDAGTVGRAMIAYIGNATGEDSKDHGLAISLYDCDGTANYSGHAYKYKTENTSAGHDYKTTSTPFASEGGIQFHNKHYASYAKYPAFQAAENNPEWSTGDSRPIPSHDASFDYYCSNWFLGTGYQWQQMIAAWGSYSNLISAFESIGGKNMNDSYWLSTEYNDSQAWYMSKYQAETFGHQDKTGSCMVRPILAF